MPTVTKNNLDPSVNPDEERYNDSIARYSSSNQAAGNPTDPRSNDTAAWNSTDPRNTAQTMKKAEDSVAPLDSSESSNNISTNTELATQEEKGFKSTVTPPEETSKFNIKKTGGIIGIVAGFIATAAFIFGLLTVPATMIVMIKEVMVHGMMDTLSTLNDKRSERIVYKMITKDPMVSGCGVVKIACRYHGMTDKQIKKFESRNANTKVVKDSNRCNAFGRCKIKGIQFYDDDGKQRFVESKNYKTYIKNSPAWRKNVYQFNKGKVAVWRDATAGKVATKLGLYFGLRTSDKKPLGSDPESDKKALEEEKKKLAERANARASKIGRFNKAAGVFGAVCIIKSLIKVADPATKAIQMAKYAAEWLNVADTIKSGKADGNSGVTNKISELGEKAVTKDSSGQTFTDSFGYQYAANGKTPTPGPGQYSLYDNREKEATDSLKKDLNDFIPGLGLAVTASLKAANDITCSPGVQYGIAVGICAAETIGTAASASAVPVAGTIAGAVTGFAACVGQTVALGVILGEGISRLVNILDNGDDDDITKNAVGGNAGNSVTSGASVMTAANLKARGAPFLGKSKAKEYDTFNDNAQGGGYYSFNDQFNIENNGSFGYKMMATLLPSLAKLSSITTVPNGILSLATAGISLPSTYARTTISDKYEICDDDDFEKKDLAADPFCVGRPGIDPRKISGDSDYNSGKVRGMTPDNNYDGDKVIDFMINSPKPWLDQDGNVIDYQSPDPDSESDYAEFLKCTEKDVTELEAGPNGICGDPTNLSEPYKTRFSMFSLYTFDTALWDQMEDNDAGGGTSAPTANNSDPSSDTGGTVSGDIKELAQKLLDSPNVSYPLDAVSPNGSTKEVLKELAAGKQAPVTCPSVGGKTDVNEGMMKFLVELSEKTKIGINAITDKCHSVGSNHYKGIAVDFECKGVPFSIGTADSIAQKYNGKRNGETCAGESHWHYDFTGN